MRLDVHLHFPASFTVKLETVTPTEVTGINRKLDTIIMNQAELAAELKEALAQIKKVGTEIDTLQGSVDTLTGKVAALEAAIAAGEVTPEVTAALAEVKTALQTVDDDIPDAPTPTTLVAAAPFFVRGAAPHHH